MINKSHLPWLERFVDGLGHYSANTIAAYRRDVEAFLGYLANEELTVLSQVTSELVRHYVAERHRQGIDGRSLGRSLSALRAFFDFLVEHNCLEHNPASQVRPPKRGRALPHTLDVDQMAAMLDVTVDSDLEIRDHAMWELLYSSGLRVSELTGLNLLNLDFAEQQARVLGKGQKERIVPVGSKALVALERWLGVRTGLAKENEQAVFVSIRGNRLGARSVQQRLRRWVEQNGIDVHVHPHMLRHSFASHILESSSDLRAVQELLGHANIGTTQIYTHLDFQHLAKVYDRAHPRARKSR